MNRPVSNPDGLARMLPVSSTPAIGAAYRADLRVTGLTIALPGRRCDPSVFEVGDVALFKGFAGREFTQNKAACPSIAFGG